MNITLFEKFLYRLGLVTYKRFKTLSTSSSKLIQTHETFKLIVWQAMRHHINLSSVDGETLKTWVEAGIMPMSEYVVELQRRNNPTLINKFEVIQGGKNVD